MNFKTQWFLLGWILGSWCTVSSLDRLVPYGIQCAGAVISEDTVLTSAHCLPEKDPTLYTVTSQIDDPREILQKFAIKLRPTEVIPHERFNDLPYNNDIGIVKVQKGHGLETIKLDFSEKKKYGTLNLASWGTDPYQQDIFYLRSLDLYAQKDEKCFQAYPDYNPEQSICVLGKDERHNSSNSDSGGAVLSDQGKIVGVVTYNGVRDHTKPGVLQSVEYHKKWITEHAPGIDYNQNPTYSNNYKAKNNYNDPKRNYGINHYSPWYKDHTSQAKDSYKNRNQNHIKDYQKPNPQETRNYFNGNSNQNQNSRWKSNPYYNTHNHQVQNQYLSNRNRWQQPVPKLPTKVLQRQQSQGSPYNKISTPVVQKPRENPKKSTGSFSSFTTPYSSYSHQL